jgi:hypothetical protein
LIRVKSGKKSTGYQYEIISPDEYEKLKESISSVLDKVLQDCMSSSADRQASESDVSHSNNGAPKAKKTNKLGSVSQRNRKDKPTDNN